MFSSYFYTVKHRRPYFVGAVYKLVDWLVALSMMLVIYIKCIRYVACQKLLKLANVLRGYLKNNI